MSLLLILFFHDCLCILVILFTSSDKNIIGSSGQWTKIETFHNSKNNNTSSLHVVLYLSVAVSAVTAQENNEKISRESHNQRLQPFSHKEEQ